MASKSVPQKESGPTKPISQKEYLKKYLSNDSGSKKKKKKKIAPTSIQRSKIVDDDLDLRNMRLLGENELDLYQLDEDAPQIAGIIDERPPELQTLESYRNSKRWKVIADSDELTISDKQAEAEEKKKLTSQNNKEIAHRFISRNITVETPSSAKSSNSKSKSNIESSKLPAKNQDSRNQSKPPQKGRYDDSGESPPRPSRGSKSKNKAESPPRRMKPGSENDSDLSPARPPRKHRSGNDSDMSPPRPSRRHKSGNDSDLSPLRPSKKHKSGNDSDLSPPRPSRRHKSGNGSDLSPPRPSKKHKPDSDSDISPPRPSRKFKSGNDSDLSPPRPSRKHKSGNDSDLSPPRPSRKYKPGHDSDPSPPRPSRKHKSGNDSDLSPPRPSRKHKSGNDSDLSPPRPSRKHKPGNDSDLSPPRPSRKYKSGHDSDLSPPRPSRKSKPGSDSDLSPPRSRTKYDDNQASFKDRRQHSLNNKSFSPRRDKDSKDHRSFSSKDHRYDKHDRKSRFRDQSPGSARNSNQNKMTETLSGKKAGLQDAAALKEENVKFQEKEDLVFKHMSASVSGEGAAAVVRDRRTGRRRDPEKEAEHQRRKAAVDGALKAKYDKWGQGIKQTQECQQRLEELMHEAQKPFARHADDEDLDDFLKNQEREGDPMLEYLREKKVKSGASANEVPVYKGPYPPNRFNIRPGYRWDGVDRSTGFEKQWFAKQNERKAVSEEAYKWSTADM